MGITERLERLKKKEDSEKAEQKMKDNTDYWMKKHEIMKDQYKQLD